MQRDSRRFLAHEEREGRQVDCDKGHPAFEHGKVETLGECDYDAMSHIWCIWASNNLYLLRRT